MQLFLNVYNAEAMLSKRITEAGVSSLDLTGIKEKAIRGKWRVKQCIVFG